MFEYDGSERPSFAKEPKEGEESVWDYPRPPKIEEDDREVIVEAEGQQIAKTTSALRVLETANPPTWYIPREDVNMDFLEESDHTTTSDWKGKATYWDLKSDDIWIQQAGWSYDMPKEDFIEIKRYISFYPSKVTCIVDGEFVKPQPGEHYGGWVTPEIVGPFKGEDETDNW